MLHWLAGQRPVDRGHDDHVEPPETPAPLFAVRAFKQAIFGTPAPSAASRSRRNSAHDREAARAAAKPSRPLMTRPRSANDATAGLRIDDLPPSPTKGILLTPGTIGERRKTVSFGDYVPEKSAKVSFQVVPAKDGSLKRGNPFETRVGLGDDEDRKSRRHTASPSSPEFTASCCDHDVHNGELFTSADEEPDCAVGKYWKREYDIYRETTSRELRKVIAKQQAAKNYARDRDEQCTALSDELRDERRKIDRLEDRTKELEAMLDDLRAQLAVATTTTIIREPRRPVFEPPVPAALPEIRPATTFESGNLHQSVRPTSTLIDAKAGRNGSTLESTPIEKPVAAVASTYQSRRRPRRHDSFEPGSSVTTSEIKNESTHLADLAKVTTIPWPTVQELIPPALAQPAEEKSIISKDGEIIPPDRVAAARARLAARRQQRTAS